MKNEVTDYEGVKAFNIARVSDPRQTDALPAQKLRLDAYSNRLKLNSEYYAFDETFLIRLTASQGTLLATSFRL
ncbi:hypothetical protein B7Z17_05225 [Candidatus Saccharibacteria bacterium 32-49-10]|nr:MAG: hypothetical protein B7Z17_05225 [Candidatus Saccharibacteria bacterium 32-49-10]